MRALALATLALLAAALPAAAQGRPSSPPAPVDSVARAAAYTLRGHSCESGDAMPVLRTPSAVAPPGSRTLAGTVPHIPNACPVTAPAGTRWVPASAPPRQAPPAAKPRG